MRDSERLTFISAKSENELNELWNNCFEGNSNLTHMNQHIPGQFQVPNNSSYLISFLRGNHPRSWLIKRLNEGDIIGYLVHGGFPGRPDSIGFNIGLNYVNKGYAGNALLALTNHLREEGCREIFGNCLATNVASIKTMVNCGFEKQKNNGHIHNGIEELTFKKTL